MTTPREQDRAAFVFLRRLWMLGALALLPALSSCGGGSGGNDGGSTPAPAPSAGEIFVASTLESAILVFALAASGDVAPLRRLGGPSAQLSRPRALFVDRVNNEIFVGNENGAVTVYPRTANGNTPPLRSLAGSATILGVAVSAPRGELYVLTQDALSVYQRTASGNTAPLRVINLAAAVTSVIGLAFDAMNEELIVAGESLVIALAVNTSGPANALRTLVPDCMGVRAVDVDPVAGELFLSCAMLNNTCPPGFGCPAVVLSGIVVHARTATGSASSLRQRVIDRTIPGAVAVNPAAREITWTGSPTTIPSTGPHVTTEAASLVAGIARDIAGSSTTLPSGPLALAVVP